jgi:hypothetical protein
MSTMPNYPSPADLTETIEMVVSLLLRTLAEPIATPARGGFGTGEVWTGCVAVSGAFNGAISLSCTAAFAMHAADKLGLRDAGDERELARDLLAEATNVVGGNIKSLFSTVLDGRCQLSMPIVTDGHAVVPHATLLHELWCDCQGERIAVRVFESEPESTQ